MTAPATAWTYDPYNRHACEGATKTGAPCRRVARCRYEWPDASKYLCGTHGRGLEPRSESGAVTWPQQGYAS